MSPNSNEQEIKNGRKAFIARGFANLTVEKLEEKAKIFNDQRILRAAGSIQDYRLIGSEGQILHLPTGNVYDCADVLRWDALPGTVHYFGCNCDDETGRLSPLREAIERAGSGAHCYCKHHWMRLLYSGAKIRTSTGLIIKIRESLTEGNPKK